MSKLYDDGIKVRREVLGAQWVDPQVEKDHIERVKALRVTRDQPALARALDALRQAAGGDENLMPYILDAVRAYGTFGEISDVLREVWGTYEEPTAAFSSL